jgi:hypothetical protein
LNRGQSVDAAALTHEREERHYKRRGADQDGDEQLGRGLDLARVHGQVDYNPDGREWHPTTDRDWIDSYDSHAP